MRISNGCAGGVGKTDTREFRNPLESAGLRGAKRLQRRRAGEACVKPLSLGTALVTFHTRLARVLDHESLKGGAV